MAHHRTLLYEKIVGANESVVASKAIIVNTWRRPSTVPEYDFRWELFLYLHQNMGKVPVPEYMETKSYLNARAPSVNTAYSAEAEFLQNLHPRTGQTNNT